MMFIDDFVADVLLRVDNETVIYDDLLFYCCYDDAGNDDDNDYNDNIKVIE